MLGRDEASADRSRPEEFLERFGIRRPWFRGVPGLLHAEFLVQGGHGTGRHVVDQLDEVGPLPIDRVGPDVVARAGVGELQVHADEITGREEVSVEHAVDV